MKQKLNFNYPLFQLITFNYLLLNRWLLNNKDLQISNYLEWIFPIAPMWFYLLVVNLLAIALFLIKKIKLSHNPIFYFAGFIVFQFFNIYDIDSVYFWETIPDSRTYVSLGLTVLECGRLSLSCTSEPFLIWPIGQPIISGFLHNYYYEIAKFIYTTIYAFAFLLIANLTYVRFKNTYHIGAIYFLILHNNFDTTSFIISEIPYIFFTAFGIQTLLKKKYQASLCLFLFSFLIRPIGFINFILFFFYIFKNKQNVLKYILVLSITLTSYMSFNYFVNGSYTIATTVSTNIQGDGYSSNLTLFEYTLGLFSQDNFGFVLNNIENLYGEGSRNCSFPVCFSYNPIFTQSGEKPILLNENSVIGRILSPILILIFHISSPLGIWVYIPLLFLFVLFSNDYLSKNLVLIYFLNMTLSVLTTEYGNRWWLILNIISVYLMTSLFSLFKSKRS